MVQFTRAQVKEGKFHSDKVRFKERVSNLPDGEYLMLFMKQTDKDTRECQNHYFLILGQWSLDTGYTKTELHELVKDELFTELFGDAVSTKDLTPEQWTIAFFNLESFLILKFENK
jgi:hypothetical protein